MANNNLSAWARCRAFYTRHPLLTGLSLMALLTVLLVWLAMLFLDVWTNHGENTRVPQIKHLPYDEARATLAANDLHIEISDSIYDNSMPPGTVMETWPKAGSVVKKDRQVYVTVNAFSPKTVTVSMPITGVSVRQAISYLNALGIRSIRQVSVPSEYPDLVESAHADGRPIGVGSSVPVDVTVVLEVGTVPEADPYAETDSISSETQILEDLSSYSEE